MFLEIVSFGNGLAIELRNSFSRMLVEYSVICSLFNAGLYSEPLPDVPIEPFRGTDLSDFEDACFRIINEIIDPQMRWIMFCSDVDIVGDADTNHFDDLYQRAFSTVASEQNDPDEMMAEAAAEVGIKLRNRIWMIDRETRRVFCVHYQFASPIYKTTLLAGVMLRHRTFRAEYRDDDLKKAAPPNTLKPGETERERILRRLKEIMPKHIEDETEAGIHEARDIEMTEFTVKDAKIWCGEVCFRGTWLAQQLNVWFNTPVTEQCWYRPHPNDPFTISSAILEEMTPPSTAHDMKRWMALPAPSVQNTMWRYPRGDVLCATPKGMLGVGHFLPLFEHFQPDQRWTETHHIKEVRSFRLYKTQYPFVYSLMPNNDQQVHDIKTKLKRSTESNPSLAEPGGAQRLKISTEVNGGGDRYTALIATIPTLECERYVKSVFQETPKHRYRVWWCARYDDNSGASVWIPVCPD